MFSTFVPIPPFPAGCRRFGPSTWCCRGPRPDSRRDVPSHWGQNRHAHTAVLMGSWRARLYAVSRCHGNGRHTPHFDLGPKPRVRLDVGQTGTGAAVWYYGPLLLSTSWLWECDSNSVDNIELDYFFSRPHYVWRILLCLSTHYGFDCIDIDI